MKDSKAKNNSTWQNLDWEKKVAICNQSIANEDSLLLTLVIMFIAFEAILFTILIGGWGQWWSIILAVFGIGFVILYMDLFEKRGSWVDLWGEMLYWLWEEAGQQDLAEHYKGCVERRCKRQKKCGRWKVIFGWGHPFNIGRFKSIRRLLNTFIPLILVIVWILVMVVSFVC